MTKSFFKQILKTSAFYLEKQKSFIPKKFFLSRCQYQNKKALFTDSIFPKVLHSPVKEPRNYSVKFKACHLGTEKLFQCKETNNETRYFQASCSNKNWRPIENNHALNHRGLKLDGAIGQGEICNSLKSENFSKSFLSHIGKNKIKS